VVDAAGPGFLRFPGAWNDDGARGLASPAGGALDPRQDTNAPPILRLFLGFAAFAWGVSVMGVFVSWSAAVEALRGLGAQPIGYDRILDYWLRMASGAFALAKCW